MTTMRALHLWKPLWSSPLARSSRSLHHRVRSLASFSGAGTTEANRQMVMRCPEILRTQIPTQWLPFHACLRCQNMWSSAPVRSIHLGSAVYKNKTSKPAKVNVPLVEQSVLLLGTDGEDLGMMNKKEAYRIADKQELKIMEIQGVEAEVPVFKLATIREYLEAQKLQRQMRRAAGGKSETKTLRMKSKISSHDLEVKLKHMREFLTKGLDVRITIQNVSGDPQVMSSLFKQITDQAEDLAQVRQAKNTAREMEIKLSVVDTETPDSKLKPFTIEELKKQVQSKSES